MPPTDRTPLIQSFGPLAVLTFKINIALWNARLAVLALTLPTLFPGLEVTYFDTHALFSTVSFFCSIQRG